MELARTNYVMCKDGVVPGWRIDALIRTAAGVGDLGAYEELLIGEGDSLLDFGWRLHAEGMMFDHHWARQVLSTSDWMGLLKGCSISCGKTTVVGTARSNKTRYGDMQRWRKSWRIWL